MNVLRRRDTEAIVDGRGADAARLGAVAQFIDDLRTEAATLPAPSPRPRLAATLDGRRPLRPASDPLPAPVRPTVAARLRRFRPATIAIASGAVFFGGLATAGALPGPLQNASADLTSHMGVHLPSTQPAPTPRVTVAPRSQPATAPTTPAANPVSTTTPDAATTTKPAGVTPVPVERGGSTQPTPPTVPTVTLPVAGPAPGPTPVTQPPILTLPSLPLHHLPHLPAPHPKDAN